MMCLRTLPPVVSAIQIGEDSVLVSQRAELCLLRCFLNKEKQVATRYKWAVIVILLKPILLSCQGKTNISAIFGLRVCKISVCCFFPIYVS